MVTPICHIKLLLYILVAALIVSGQQPESTPESQSEPKPEPTPEPKPEPTPEPKPEGPDAEPEGPEGTEGIDDGKSPYAEPEPDWKNAKSKWGIGWQVHVYGFGACFALVALYAFLSVLRLWRRKHLLSQPYFLSLNLLVGIMSTSRSIYLLVDAYNSSGTFPSVIAYIMYTIVFPCLTSAFSLMFFALLSATRMTFVSKSVQKLKVFYLAWGLFLFVGFMFLFKRLYKAALLRQRLMLKHMSRKLGIASKQHKPQKLTLSLGVKVTLVSAILGLFTAALLIYGMVDVYGVFNYLEPEAWRWWGYHTTFRILELAMSITITYVATQPFRFTDSTSEGDDRNCTSYVCAPCLSWCYRDHNYLLPDEDWSDFRSESYNSESIKRTESQKGDFPLHHMRRSSQDHPSPTSQFNTPMLKADHGQLVFTERSSEQNSGDLLDSNSQHCNNVQTDQATLKIDRELMQNDLVAAGENLLSSNDQNKQMNAIGRGASLHNSNLSINSSQQSLDRVSQLSPELESDGDDETNGLLADV